MSDRLLPYDTIIKAHEGDPIAIQAVLNRYAGYIRYFSKMNGLKPAVDSPARFRKWVIKGRQQKVLPPFPIIEERGIFHDRTGSLSRTYPLYP